MQVVQTIELTKDEQLTVQRFLKLTDTISDIARCSMDDVFLYFADAAECVEDGEYSIDKIHQIKDIH